MDDSDWIRMDGLIVGLVDGPAMFGLLDYFTGQVAGLHSVINGHTSQPYTNSIHQLFRVCKRDLVIGIQGVPQRLGKK